MTGTLDSSLSIGTEILGEMGQVAQRLHKKKVEQAAFLVLKSPDIPSILVETGFISNPKESALLATPSYQTEMAAAIFVGVERWFRANPPPGTVFARASSAPMPAGRSVKVVRGDTLSGIASRYSVTLEALKSKNDLSSNSIRVGQVLIIPESG
jgi:N-acetylmuramoyl-L-alanine amidase